MKPKPKTICFATWLHVWQKIFVFCYSASYSQNFEKPILCFR